jgi:hypothetical protein
VPLIGCTTAGEIAASGPRDASVVVTALGGRISVESPPGEGTSVQAELPIADRDGAGWGRFTTMKGSTVENAASTS